jgi:hypothetical protein
VPRAIVPFGLIVGGLRHISATRAAITAVLELVVPIVVAWTASENAWTGVRLSGPVRTLSTIGIVHSAY